ncbi:hypothetical protein NEOLEDRAFT_908290 [Neolentinus lepideus HHB14362 ss-1]|uniref:Uncharacterized protein n=1 Tax=Neolentinus lepideus HHB14362 ss-1 TaxID=1314782 RepID=A0A165UJI8_9AGAM|nr:hypothetical protein NEOLEDRAFT_908290 [Neolentinus lepideus HHB14362 ss-1]
MHGLQRDSVSAYREVIAIPVVRITLRLFPPRVHSKQLRAQALNAPSPRSFIYWCEAPQVRRWTFATPAWTTKIAAPFLGESERPVSRIVSRLKASTVSQQNYVPTLPW